MMPPELHDSLKMLRNMFGVPVSEFCRQGIERALADFIPEIVKLIDDPRTPAMSKLELAGWLRQCAAADLARSHPDQARYLRKVQEQLEVERRKEARRRRKAAKQAATGDAIDAASGG